MPTILLLLVVRGLIAVVTAIRGKQFANKPKPLCNECAFAHIQFGACGKRAISCTYGGGVRSLAIDVLYCTGYQPRFVPARPAMGFVQITAR